MSFITDNPKTTQHPYDFHSVKSGETYPKDIQLLDPLDKPVVTSPATMTSSFTTEETGEKAEKTQEFDDETMLQKRIKALENEIDDLKKRNRELESQMREGLKSQKQTSETLRFLKSSYDQLQKEFEKINTERGQLQFSTENEVHTKKLETLTEELEGVKKENSKLKRKLEELTETCKRLENKKTRLDIGQVALLLEKEIWKAVLPHIKPGKVAIFDSMEEWLKENKWSAEGIAAQKRWDNLKYQLNWKEQSWRKKNHRKALYLLRDIRKEVAHPTEVDLEAARQQLKDGDYVAEYQKESCTDIIEMLKMLTNLNSPK